MKNDAKVYCVMGDGECQEGQVWEAFMIAGHYKFDNLIVFLDNNNLQIDGSVEDVMNIYTMKSKMEAFNVIEIDRNDIDAVISALEKAKGNVGKPTMIIGKPSKAKGFLLWKTNLDGMAHL